MRWLGSMRGVSGLRTNQSCGSHRTFVFVRQTSAQIRGLKKPEVDYLTGSNGVQYPGTSDTLAQTKKLLGQQYALPDKAILQVLTHKSFAHGKKPFNEKLSILGNQFLRLHANEHAVSQKSDSSTTVGGYNFDVSMRVVELLSSTTVLAEVARLAQLDADIFWVKPNESVTAPERSGANTVAAKTINALVGAVLLHHGEHATRRFVDETLFSGPFSVLKVGQHVYKCI